MPPTAQPVYTPRAIFAAMKRRPSLWIVPTAVVAIAGFAYALFHTPDWESSQAMMIRDEAIGSLARPGRFESVDSMKTAQETVLELAKSHNVIEAALRDVGPRSTPAVPNWPTPQDVERASRTIKVTAPHGAEFGRTEVFYLTVKDTDPVRAAALTSALCQQLESRLQHLRDSKAQSLVDELARTAALAQADLDTSTQRLADCEREVGEDLAELRILNESSSGESNLRRTLVELKSELRAARANQRTNQQLLEMLQAAQHDPTHLVATPNRLLESQPALRQMKDGLVAAQIRTAELLGDMSETHPKVQASLASQDEIRRHLHDELKFGITSLEAELRLGEARVAALENQVQDIDNRMTRLASVRAGYSNLVADVRQRSETLNKAQKDLADARASHAAAHSASLLTLLDRPVTGAYPVGPRRSVIVLVALCGGLFLGVGIVVLTMPTADSTATAAAAGEVAEPADVRPAPPTLKPQPAPLLRGLNLKQALVRITQLSPSRN